jgi:hypothetical protein
MKMKFSKSLVVHSVAMASVLFLTFTRDAYAYLDPGTGSYILQLVIAALLGASLAIKIYWGNIKKFFATRVLKTHREEQDEKGDSK